MPCTLAPTTWPVTRSQEGSPLGALAAAWDILKSHAALAYDPDGKCLYENFGHLNRG
jgi:hypothetical protein